MTARVYLDWNATAPLRPAARAAVVAALDAANPSSVHAEGRRAGALVETARARVAALVGARARDVVFTASATEANNLALQPALEPAGDSVPRGGLVISAVEHASVRAGHRFPVDAVETAAADRDGVVTAAAVAEALGRLAARGGRRPLVSVTLASNETGVIQPVAAIAEVVRAAGGDLHVDAVQAAGRIAIDLAQLGADLLTLSSHKLGGPKGAGALVLGARAPHVAALVRGGGQERGRRAGTEDVAAIAGFGAAAAEAAAELDAAPAAMARLRQRLEDGLLATAPAALVLGAGAPRLPNTVLVALAGLSAETAVIAFDLAGVSVSAGAACSSGKVGRSHVVEAMGRPDLAASAIRLSLGPATTRADVDRALDVWRGVVCALHNDRRGAA